MRAPPSGPPVADWIGDRLVLEGLVAEAGHPVERVLERARNGPIVFRRNDDDAVGGADGIGQRYDVGRKAAARLQIGIIERKAAERRRFRERHAGRRQRGQRVHERAVERSLAQAAANHEGGDGHFGVLKSPDVSRPDFSIAELDRDGKYGATTYAACTGRKGKFTWERAAAPQWESKSENGAALKEVRRFRMEARARDAL